MKFYFFAHQKKELALVDALLSAGWQLTGAKDADVIFADNDYGHLRPQLEGYHRKGKTIMIYPHAGRVCLFNDLPDGQASECVAVQFVTAEGHKEIFQRFGYPRPVEVIGWHLCPMREFQPREQIKNILFAPIHPDVDGTLYDVDKQINAAAFAKLLPLAKDGTINLTVRHIRSPRDNGIPLNIWAKYIQGKPDQSYKEIDEADLVVSYGTFAALALARGVPLVGMGEATPPHLGERVVKSWYSYKGDMKYPYDILCTNNTAETIDLLKWIAFRDAMLVEDWRKRMIGKSFDPARFVELVNKYI